MRFEALLAPLSEDAPCGPDLDELGDDEYLNYMLPAGARLPERFFDQDGAPFDGKSIDLKAEMRAISGLLARSRDLRLLTLEARFQCLAGQIVAFGECIEAIRGLLEAFWPSVHPVSFDGDFTLRQNTLASLDDRTSIILPLQYAALVRDKRVGPISLRDYFVATGVAQARDGGLQIDATGILDALRREEKGETVQANLTAIITAERALGAIRNRFIAEAGYENAPSFDGLQQVLAQLRELIETARPEFKASAQPTAEATDINGDASDDTPALAPARQAADVVPAWMSDQAAASAALAAIESYFARSEPSSPVLPLVRQAQLLVGVSLLEAIRILIPEAAERAVIALGAGLKLQLTTSFEAASVCLPADSNAAPPAVVATTREEAATLLAGVEAFFHANEPSSPIPLLLAKAKQFMDQSFSSILSDLLKTDQP